MIYLYKFLCCYGIKREARSILEAQNVSISYGKNIIFDNACFSVPEGGAYAILGRNGSGKSTLLTSLSGVCGVDSGSVTLNGVSVREKAAQREIGFVPQNDIAFDNLSVHDNIAFWGASFGLNEKNAVASPAVELLGLTDVMRQKAKFLSGGMRKRLCVAACMLHSPRVLILDEPFSAIDIVAKREFLGFLSAFKEEEKTIIITSHNASELTALCDSFFFITGKRLERAGDIGRLGSNPDEYVAQIIERGE